MDRYTDEQIQEFHDAFCMFDRQQRGYILSNELRDMLKTIGFNPTDEVLEIITITCDLDGNGEIDFNEFIDVIDKLETDEIAEKEAQDAFNAFDFLSEGYIAANDMKEALLYIMTKSPEAEKQQILKHFKLEKNRKIRFKEFKEMITTARISS